MPIRPCTILMFFYYREKLPNGSFPVDKIIKPDLYKSLSHTPMPYYSYFDHEEESQEFFSCMNNIKDIIELFTFNKSVPEEVYGLFRPLKQDYIFIKTDFNIQDLKKNCISSQQNLSTNLYMIHNFCTNNVLLSDEINKAYFSYKKWTRNDPFYNTVRSNNIFIYLVKILNFHFGYDYVQNHEIV